MNNTMDKIDIFTLKEGDVFYGYSVGLTEIKTIKWIFVRAEGHGSSHIASFINVNTMRVSEFYEEKHKPCLRRKTDDTKDTDSMFIFPDGESARLYAQQLFYLSKLNHIPLTAEEVYQLRNMCE